MNWKVGTATAMFQVRFPWKNACQVGGSFACFSREAKHSDFL